jgi:hypothetical protein
MTSLADLRARRCGIAALAGRVLAMAWLALRSYHLTFEWRDPLPTAHMFWHKFLKNPLRRRLPLARALPR